MLSEITVNKCSQLCYLELPAGVLRSGPPTVGGVADYYTHDSVGGAYLQARFGANPREYANWKKFLADGIADIRAFRIRNVMDDNCKDGSGFYGCSYLSPEGDLVAAFRGSEMLGNRRYWNDYETDLSLAYEEQTRQQAVVERYLRAFDDFRSRPFYLTGHSLGGNLALYGAVRTQDTQRLVACYAFNAPGFCGRFISSNKARIAMVRKRLYLMQNRHDIVSSLLRSLTEPVILASRFNPREEMEEPEIADILYPHSNFMYLADGDRFARDPLGRKDSLCRLVGTLSELLLLLPAPALKGIAGLLLEALYAPRSPEKQVDYLLEQVTRYMVRQGVEGSPDGLTLSTGLFLARQLAKGQTGGELYRRLTGEEEAGQDGLAYAVLLLFKLAQALCGEDGCGQAKRREIQAPDTPGGLDQYSVMSAS